jgi:catechol 2,3-dioxygenase-like lactoylglutathione lyase family enzyme
MRLGHVAIVASDLERSLAFYTGLAGLQLTERIEYPDDGVGHGVAVAAGAFLRCDETHHRLAIFVLRGGGDPSAVGGLHHLAFELESPEALLAKLAQLQAAGTEIVNHRKGGPGNQPRFYARDPDGHLVEFYWGIDTIGPDGRPPAHEPITEIVLEEFDFRARAAALERLARR